VAEGAGQVRPGVKHSTTGAHALVIIPTYNERENLPRLLDGLFAYLPDAHALVVDDNSPDGTGQIADDRARGDSRVRVLHRPGKQGLGKAYIAGFHQALLTEAQYIFEMDADFSHDPKYLPLFMERIQHADVVIGSRYVRGGGVTNWGFHRKLISSLGNTFARVALNLRARDCTAGYKCYRRSVLEALALDDIHSEGYAFQVEMIYRCQRHGFRITEFPIIFPDRVLGASKMSKKIIVEALVFVFRARFGLVR